MDASYVGRDAIVTHKGRMIKGTITACTHIKHYTLYWIELHATGEVVTRPPLTFIIC